MIAIESLKNRSSAPVIVAIEQSKNSINYKNIKVKILDSRIQNLVFVFGNEVGGLSKEDLKLCDLVAEVPMRGAMVRQAHHPCNMKQGKESLNVAVCVGIVLYSLLNTK